MSRPVPAVFGSVFHAEMPVIAYREGKWQPVEWQSSKDLTIAPGAHALHYGSECFEGLKAFRQANGKIVMFRPTANIARMQQSADILHLPRPETEAYLNALIELVKRSAEEIPDAPAALYLRPTLIGTDPVIGKAGSPSETALLYILASPVGDYSKPVRPLKSWWNRTYPLRPTYGPCEMRRQLRFRHALGIESQSRIWRKPSVVLSEWRRSGKPARLTLS